MQNLYNHYLSYHNDPFFPTNPILSFYFTLIDLIKGDIPPY